MKRILISGGKGQLGQCLKNIIPNTSEFETVYVDINELDISNYQDVSKFLKKNSFDYCVNCAAYTAVDLAEDQPEMAQKVNIIIINLGKGEMKKDTIIQEVWSISP